jgi:hypothetical protein
MAIHPQLAGRFKPTEQNACKDILRQLRKRRVGWRLDGPKRM